jgi:hypothetical protein
MRRKFYKNNILGFRAVRQTIKTPTVITIHVNVIHPNTGMLDTIVGEKMRGLSGKQICIRLRMKRKIYTQGMKSYGTSANWQCHWKLLLDWMNSPMSRSSLVER